MVFAPLVIVITVTPLIIIVSLLVVALLMTPVLVRLVALLDSQCLNSATAHRFCTAWVGRSGLHFWRCWHWSFLFHCGLFPALVLVLPPLIWGWLTYRVMAFDALATHATADERHNILVEHRLPLLGMGLVAGYLGAAPSLLWATGALSVPWFVYIAPLAIWIYVDIRFLVAVVHALLFGCFLHALRARQNRVANKDMRSLTKDSFETLEP